MNHLRLKSIVSSWERLDNGRCDDSRNNLVYNESF